MDMRTHAPVTSGVEQIEPWRLLLRDGSDLVAVVGSGGLVRYVSSSVTRICGYRPDEVLGKSFLDFVHPDDAIAARERLKGLAAHGERTCAAEYRFRHEDGEWTVLEALVRPGRLSAPELALIRTHPQAGWEIVKGVESPWPVARMILQHHERLDGSGYPNGLRGDEILIEARILAVADVVEAMSSHRPYRPSLGLDAALAHVEAHAGVLYDARAVAACARVLRAPGCSWGTQP